jgi:hypothetical protein
MRSTNAFFHPRKHAYYYDIVPQTAQTSKLLGQYYNGEIREKQFLFIAERRLYRVFRSGKMDREIITDAEGKACEVTYHPYEPPLDNHPVTLYD